MSFYKGPMYHGTDKKILRMDKKEREERLALCASVSDYLYHFLKSKDVALCAYSEEQRLNKEILKDIWIKFWDCGMTKYSGFINKSQLYQYDGLYVTNGFDRAVRFAKSSSIIGERGDVTYWLHEGAIRYDDYYDNASDEIKTKIKRFEEIMKEPSEPVVVVLDNLDKQYIKNENGTEIDWDLFEEDFVDGTSLQSFKLINPQDYDLSVMRQIDVG